jgi:hypothetical protein
LGNALVFEICFPQDPSSSKVVYKRNPENGLWSMAEKVQGAKRDVLSRLELKVSSEDPWKVGDPLTDEELAGLVNTFLTGEPTHDNETSPFEDSVIDNP